jgi:gamma-glutamyltranspeptidase/glutathione hydrolase
LAVTSHPDASEAAAAVLRDGGNACDAALAAAAMQTVVEPHMTTITGILSMLYYDAATGRTEHCNGSMNAPLAPLPGFAETDLETGRAVAVPGFWPAFEATLARWGSLPKSRIMAPAIAAAEEGFEIYPFLFGEMFAQSHALGRTEGGREIFFDGGRLKGPGELLIQRRAADTLRRLEADGESYFRGEFAQAVCAAAAADSGVITPADFERYEVRWDEPARGTYRGHELVGSPPPDTGGTHVIEALHMLAHSGIEKLGPPAQSAEALWLLIAVHNEVLEAGAKLGDPRSHRVPLSTLLSPSYAAARLELVKAARAYAPQSQPTGSNHVTVVDRAGNAATVLHSCMSTPWINGLFAAGVSVCSAGTHFLRTMPQPGDRGTCIIAPTMVMHARQPYLVCGSPSMSLIANILQNVVNIVDFGMTLEESVHQPRFGYPTPDGRQDVEADFPPHVLAGLRDRGVPTRVVSPWYWLNGSLEAIMVDPVTGLRTACPDPRRTSVAVAE